MAQIDLEGGKCTVVHHSRAGLRYVDALTLAMAQEIEALRKQRDEYERRYTESVGGSKRDLQKRLADQRAKNVRLQSELVEKQEYILELEIMLSEAKSSGKTGRAGESA